MEHPQQQQHANEKANPAQAHQMQKEAEETEMQGDPQQTSAVGHDQSTGPKLTGQEALRRQTLTEEEIKKGTQAFAIQARRELESEADIVITAEELQAIRAGRAAQQQTQMSFHEVRSAVAAEPVEEIERLVAAATVEELRAKFLSSQPEMLEPEVNAAAGSVLYSTPQQGPIRAGNLGGSGLPSAIPRASASPHGNAATGPVEGIHAADLFNVLKQQTEMQANLTAIMLNQTQHSQVSQIVRVRDEEQIKIPRFKDIDIDKGVTVSHVLLEWETYFRNKGTSPSVPAVIQAIDKGGNLYSWMASNTMRHATALTDPDSVHNWDWHRFKEELFASSLHVEEDQCDLFEEVVSFKFASCNSIAQVRDGVTKFEIAANRALAANLSAQLPTATLAMKLYSSLPDDFRALMAQYDAAHSRASARHNYMEVKKEISQVLTWQVTRNFYSQKTVSQRGNTVRANAAANTTAAGAPHGGTPRVGTEQDYVVIMQVLKQYRGPAGRVIDEGLNGLRARDKRFQSARKATKAGNGNEIVVITHPDESVLKSLDQDAGFRILKPFLGDLKPPFRNSAGSKGKPTTTAAPASIAGNELQELRAELLTSMEALRAETKSVPHEEPLSRANTEKSADLLAAAAPSSGSTQLAPVQHPNITGVRGLQTYRMPSAHDHLGARVAVKTTTHKSASIEQEEYPEYLAAEGTKPASLQPVDYQQRVEQCKTADPDLWDCVNHQADFDYDLALQLFEQEYVPIDDTTDRKEGELMVLCDYCGESSTLMIRCPTGANYCDHKCQREEWKQQLQQKHEQKHGVHTSVTQIEDQAPGMNLDDDVACLQAVFRRYLQQSLERKRASWDASIRLELQTIDNLSYDIHAVDDTYLQSSCVVMYQGTPAICMHVCGSNTLPEPDIRVGGANANIKVRALQRNCKVGKNHNQNHLKHSGPRYFGANLIDDQERFSRPPAETKSPQSRLACSRTLRGFINTDVMGTIIGLFGALFFPSVHVSLGRDDSLTVTSTWIHIIAIAGLTATIDRDVVMDVIHIATAIGWRGFHQLAVTLGQALGCVIQLIRYTKTRPAIVWAALSGLSQATNAEPVARSGQTKPHAITCADHFPVTPKQVAIAVSVCILLCLGVAGVASFLKGEGAPASGLPDGHGTYRMPSAGEPWVQFANPAYSASAQHQEDIQAARACAVINCANSLPQDARMAMIDSGTTDLMFQHDNVIQEACVDFDSADVALGKSANSTFTTDGTATVGIGFDYDTPEGERKRHNVSTRVTLCSNWNFDLVPPRWFQSLGHSVIFDGRTSLRDFSDGHTAITLHQLTNEGRHILGQVPIIEWSNLSFFPYYLYSPSSAPISAAANIAGSRGARCSATAMYHVIFGHSGMRRIRACLAPAGVDVSAELPCPCSICAEACSEMPSRRHFARINADRGTVSGTPFAPADPTLAAQMHEMLKSDASAPDVGQIHDCQADELHTDAEFKNIQNKWDEVLINTPDHELHRLIDDASFPEFGSSVRRKSTRPGQMWHCDTIPLPNTCWDRITQALVLVDDYSRKVFVYGMKSKNGETTAFHLREHFLKLGLAFNPESINFFTHRMVLHSDQGSEFINHEVKELCTELGCTQEFSCPGDSGKWQNGIVERRIKELGNVARKLMATSDMIPQGRCHALYHAADIINTLPTSANPNGRDSVGLPPNFVYDQTPLDLELWYAFGSKCFAHLDSDHASKDVNAKAAQCVYLCQAHHKSASGHIVWDLRGKRRLTVPKLTNSPSAHWNSYPLRPQGEQHLSMFMTWVSPPVDVGATVTDLPMESAPLSSEGQDIIDHRDGDIASSVEGEPDTAPPMSKHRLAMMKNVGKKVRKVFFINGTDGPLDYYEGNVHHVTTDNRYHVVYWDGDSEDLTHRQFLRYHRDPDRHRDIIAQAATLIEEADSRPVSSPKCKCHPDLDVCHHPWNQPPNTYRHIANVGATSKVPHHSPSTSTSKGYVPISKVPSTHELDYYAMVAFGHLYTGFDVQQALDETCMFKFSPINPTVAVPQHEGTIASAARSRKGGNLSAYPADPQSILQCTKSPDWTSAEQGNTWQESVLSEWGNFKRFDVVESVSRKDVPDTHDILPTIINFLTKRKKDSTPALPVIDKRKTRICLGGHKCIPGVHFERQEAYAPVPTWGVVKLQLALTALHGLKLKAFDATAAYLQTPMEKEVYANPPKGLIELLNETGEGPFPADTVWRLKKCLYGHPLGAALWYRKLFTFLKSYGFQQLGNSASMLLLRRTTGKNRGIIILNVYSDDGLASIDNEELWSEFMQDFKAKFEVLEKDPDYFLGAGIIQHDDGSVDIDPSKYLRESVAKYDMDKAVTSPLPMPAGTKMYMDHGAPLDDEGTNLYQQMTGTIMYASLLRPELSYYASQLGKVMSSPSEPHMVLARKVLQFISGTLEERHTFHPPGHAGFSDRDLSLLAFSDSDWACSVDTRRSHGCYVIMMAGAAVSWRSRSHKSVMLSTAAAEYYEASEACREVAFIRGILEDFYDLEVLEPTPLYVDNQACIAMGQMPQFTEKQKHIPIRVCHLKECCDDKMVQLRPVATYNELADIGTKALPLPAFNRLRQVLRGQLSFSSLLANPPV